VQSQLPPSTRSTPARPVFGGLQQVGESGGGVEQPFTLMAIMWSHAPASAPAVGAQEHQPGIVDQGVQPPESLDGLLHGGLGLGAFGDVCFHPKGW
jgi:hypothetical protein